MYSPLLLKGGKEGGVSKAIPPGFRGGCRGAIDGTYMSGRGSNIIVASKD